MHIPLDENTCGGAHAVPKSKQITTKIITIVAICINYVIYMILVLKTNTVIKETADLFTIDKNVRMDGKKM